MEDTTAQLTWSGTEPGCRLVEGLPPGTAGAVDGVMFCTLDALPGSERTRVATIGDLHLGSRTFGHRRTIVERPRPDEDASLRCARAAISEALAWGAELLVVKGDVTHNGREREWDRAAELLGALPVPVVLVAGNHDRGTSRSIEPEAAAAQRGLRLAGPVEVVDRPGLRVVVADTSVAGRSHGRLAAAVRGAVVEAAREAGGAVLVALHHHLPRVPRSSGWPPGLPAGEGRALLKDLARAHPATLVTSGHTHRHRRRRHGPITVTQVGSTKDYPGVWAGYVVHDGGLRQVVRRVAEPSCLRWTDRTGAGVAGQWHRIGPGHLDDRCFTVRW